MGGGECALGSDDLYRICQVGNGADSYGIFPHVGAEHRMGVKITSVSHVSKDVWIYRYRFCVHASSVSRIAQ